MQHSGRLEADGGTPYRRRARADRPRAAAAQTLCVRRRRREEGERRPRELARGVAHLLRAAVALPDPARRVHRPRLGARRRPEPARQHPHVRARRLPDHRQAAGEHDPPAGRQRTRARVRPRAARVGRAGRHPGRAAGDGRHLERPRGRPPRPPHAVAPRPGAARRVGPVRARVDGARGARRRVGVRHARPDRRRARFPRRERRDVRPRVPDHVAGKRRDAATSWRARRRPRRHGPRCRASAGHSSRTSCATAASSTGSSRWCSG